MSNKRKNRPEKSEIEKQSEYYRLKTQAVDDLVSANEENSPQVSEEELRAYRSGPKMKLADWVKMLLIKAWFAGAVCFFFIWGLGGLLSSELDILFVTGLALGVVTDLMTNPVLRFFEKTPGERPLDDGHAEKPFRLVPQRRLRLCGAAAGLWAV